MLESNLFGFDEECRFFEEELVVIKRKLIEIEVVLRGSVDWEKDFYEKFIVVYL